MEAGPARRQAHAACGGMSEMAPRFRQTPMAQAPRLSGILDTSFRWWYQSVEHARTSGLRRQGTLLLAYGCTGAGAAGLVVPLLPTTPFLLVAVWAATRAKPGFAYWLRRHRRLGPPLRAWERERALTYGAKCSAAVLVASSVIVLWWAATPAPVLAGVSLGLAVVLGFVFTRPTASRLTTDTDRPRSPTEAVR